jgi:hypothetical protein
MHIVVGLHDTDDRLFANRLISDARSILRKEINCCLREADLCIQDNEITIFEYLKKKNFHIVSVTSTTMLRKLITVLTA